MSNADRIRSMTDEELSEFLHKYSECSCICCIECGTSCKEQTLKWLKSSEDILNEP